MAVVVLIRRLLVLVKPFVVLCALGLTVGCNFNSSSANFARTEPSQQTNATSEDPQPKWRGYRVSDIVESCGTYDKTFDEFLDCFLSETKLNPDIGMPPRSELYMRGVVIRWMKSTSRALDKNAQEIKEQSFFAKIFDPIEPYDEWRFIANLREQMAAAESVADTAGYPVLDFEGVSFPNLLENPDLTIRVID